MVAATWAACRESSVAIFCEKSLSVVSFMETEDRRLAFVRQRGLGQHFRARCFGLRLASWADRKPHPAARSADAVLASALRALCSTGLSFVLAPCGVGQDHLETAKRSPVIVDRQSPVIRGSMVHDGLGSRM